MPSWRLANAAELAAAYKYTFYRPSAETIGKVAIGDNVKLIFEYAEDHDTPDGWSAERMWVLVDHIDGNGNFRGRLDNAPRHIADLQLGDALAFSDIHIIQVEHDDNDGNHFTDRYRKRCLVSVRVLHDGEPIGSLYRETPEQEDDSGWRILAGDETDDYFDDEDAVAYVSLGAVLNRDDAILPLLDTAPGSSFQREAGTDRFVADEPDGDA